MNEELYTEVMSILPGAFPTSRIGDFESIKFSWWKDFKDFEDKDFIRGINEVRRTWKGSFPALAVVLEAVEKAKADRIEYEYRSRKQEELSSRPFSEPYISRDTDSEYNKQLSKDTFQMIRDGIDSCDIPGELKKLFQKYPKERWMYDLAEKIEYERKTDRHEVPVVR